MNSTIRNLIIAAPLATAAFALVPTAAMAVEPGPVIVIQPSDPDPEPKPGLKLKAPEPQPDKPKGPQDKAPAPKPEQPQDKAPLPKPVDPDGPGGVITAPKPCPTHGVDCTPNDDKKGPNDGGEGGNGGGDGSGDQVVDKTVDKAADAKEVAGLTVPNRIDAGLAAEEQGGTELSWLIAGGALVTATGAAFAVRRRARQQA